MAEKVNVYNLSEGGVQLVKDDQHMADNELRQGQNAQFGNDKSGGGIESRAGMAKFNAVAMSGPITGFINVALIDTVFEPPSLLSLPTAITTVPDVFPIMAGDGTSESTVGSEPTAWEACRDNDDANYWHAVIADSNSSDRAFMSFDMSATIDPGVNTGHQMVFRFRIGPTEPTGGMNVFIGVRSVPGDEGIIEAYFGLPDSLPATPSPPRFHTSDTPGYGATFVELTYDLTAADVIAFRAAGGYTAWQARIDVTTGSISGPTTCDFDLSYVALIVPPAP